MFKKRVHMCLGYSSRSFKGLKSYYTNKCYEFKGGRDIDLLKVRKEGSLKFVHRLVY